MYICPVCHKEFKRCSNHWVKHLDADAKREVIAKWFAGGEKYRFKKGQTPVRKGKTNIEYYGEGRAAEIAEKSSLALRGHSSWAKGLTKDTDKRIAQTEAKREATVIAEGTFKGVNNPMYGKTHTPETRERLRQCNLGVPCSNPLGWGKGGFKGDLQRFFRSTWEANFARVLNYIGIQWEYETKRFKFDDCSYCPDFYLPQFDMWIEVKGWLKPIDRYKLTKMHQEYPHVMIKVLDGEGYKILSKKYASLLPVWEGR